MDMSGMEEDQVVPDSTQVVGNNRASPTMMGLHDILRNIEQMLVPFKYYIKAYEAGMAQARLMAQALSIVQTTHANVPTCSAKEPNFIMSEKFDGTRLKFRSFVQQVNFFLRLHPSRYPNDSTQCYHGMPFLGLHHSWKRVCRFYKTWLNLKPSLLLHLVIVIGRGWQR
jgi:hypothetical protein